MHTDETEVLTRRVLVGCQVGPPLGSAGIGVARQMGENSFFTFVAESEFRAETGPLSAAMSNFSVWIHRLARTIVPR
jgi:hypothetical protein